MRELHGIITVKAGRVNQCFSLRWSVNKKMYSIIPIQAIKTIKTLLTYLYIAL